MSKTNRLIPSINRTLPPPPPTPPPFPKEKPSQKKPLVLYLSTAWASEAGFQLGSTEETRIICQ